jgi:lysophospholipase L1-like esterase
MKRISIFLLLFVIVSFILPKKKQIKIFMAGDSTMAIKETNAFPETGWGMPFVYFWDNSVTVVNKAKNGASTRTFREDGLWLPIQQQEENGDYVFIQFGHNDEVPTKKSYTTPQEFQKNLKQYINETRSKNAIPILLTPVARRKFDSTGHIEGTHEEYSKLVRQIAVEENVVLIDLDKISQSMYQQFGADKSKLLFVQLQKGEHPNYPDGREDNTHFSEFGARLVAELVLNAIKEKIPELAERIVSQKHQ